MVIVRFLTLTDDGLSFTVPKCYDFVVALFKSNGNGLFSPKRHLIKLIGENIHRLCGTF
jgi:hypothetical protein